MVQNSDSPSDAAYGDNLDLGTMDQLLSLDDGELGLLEEMLCLYREDTPDRIKAIEHTLGAGEMVDMADVAHAIKGAASTMGAPRVRVVAAALETGGRLGKFDTEPKVLLERLKVAYQDSLDAMDAFVASRKS